MQEIQTEATTGMFGDIETIENNPTNKNLQSDWKPVRLLNDPIARCRLLSKTWPQPTGDIMLDEEADPLAINWMAKIGPGNFDLLFHVQTSPEAQSDFLKWVLRLSCSTVSRARAR